MPDLSVILTNSAVHGVFMRHMIALQSLRRSAVAAAAARFGSTWGISSPTPLSQLRKERARLRRRGSGGLWRIPFKPSRASNHLAAIRGSEKVQQSLLLNFFSLWL